MISRITLRSLIAPLTLAAFSVLLAGCVANTPRQMTAVPSPVPLLGLAGKPAFETADKWSFTQAVFNYTTGGKDEYHKIPVGDYLLARFVDIASKDSSISALRMQRFDSSGRMGFGLVGRHIATLRVDVSYLVNGRSKSFTYEFKDRDIGGVSMGDSQVAPLIGYAQTKDSIFHDQIRPILEEIAAAFSKEIQANSTTAR